MSNIQEEPYYSVEQIIQLFTDSYQKNSEIVEMTNDQEKRFMCTVLYNYLSYKPNIVAYADFITVVAELTKEIGIENNSISYSRVIENLIHQGYLSDSLQFNSMGASAQYFDLRYFFGMDVVNGYGCCRHVADIHQKVFQKLQMSSHNFPCILSRGEILIHEGMDKMLNHIANVILYDGCYYVYDVFNSQIYYPKNSIVMKRYSENSDNAVRTLFYKPEHDMLFNYISYSQACNQIHDFDEDSRKQHIAYKELEEILCETDDRYIHSQDILEDFVSKSKEYKKKIISGVPKASSSI